MNKETKQVFFRSFTWASIAALLLYLGVIVGYPWAFNLLILESVIGIIAVFFLLFTTTILVYGYDALNEEAKVKLLSQWHVIKRNTLSYKLLKGYVNLVKIFILIVLVMYGTWPLVVIKALTYFVETVGIELFKNLIKKIEDEGLTYHPAEV